MLAGDWPSVATIRANWRAASQLHRTLPLQHLGELAEEGDALERIVTEWTGAAHWGTIGS